jgi:hypothetical protein
MKRFIVFFIASILAISCSKDDVPGITGEFIGTYYKISSSGSFDDISRWYGNHTTWPSSHAVVTVSISEAEGTMKILIDSDFGRERISGPYTEKNGTYECEGVKISNGTITYSYHPTPSLNHSNYTGYISGKYLIAYQ